MKPIYSISVTISWIISFSLLPLLGCRKLVQVSSPVTSLTEGNVYATNATAASVLTGIYSAISEGNNPLSVDGNFTSMSFGPSLSADELTLYDINNGSFSYYYTNNLDPVNHYSGFWGIFYRYIFNANSVIAGLNNANSLAPAVQKQLLGEALFIRAFCYFYLSNLYGNVALALSTDYKTNAGLPCTSKALVDSQIITDLKESQSLLSPVFLGADAETAYPAGAAQRVRPTLWAATALLARVYLYSGQNYADAEAQASSIINNTSLFNLTGLDSTFLENSNETIWALQPVNGGTNANTGEGDLFILPPTGPNTSGTYPVYLNIDLVNSFEPNDQRRAQWVDSVIVGTTTYYYPYKYKIGAVDTATGEYIMVLRLAEQYLIRAEARAKQGNIIGAQADLNIIRARANLPNTNASDQPSLMAAILQERRVELFTEWGHRWLDLQRTGAIDSVMNIASIEKGSSWSSYKALYPVPQTEINMDPNLTQNLGY